MCGSPKRRTIALSAAVALTPATTNALAGETWFKVSANPWFDGWQRQLQALVDRDGHEARNRICIVGAKADGRVLAYVYWPTDHSLITWFPAPGDPDALLHETHVLDLGKDVVATDAAVAGSTYRVTRAWVRDVASHCRTVGTTMIVTRHPAQAHAGDRSD